MDLTESFSLLFEIVSTVLMNCKHTLYVITRAFDRLTGAVGSLASLSLDVELFPVPLCCSELCVFAL